MTEHAAQPSLAGRSGEEPLTPRAGADEPECLRGDAERIANALKLLTHPDRILLLWKLSQREMCVGELEEELDIRQPTLSQQLGVLRSEGAVSARREGKHIYYRGIPDPALRELVAFLQGPYRRHWGAPNPN